MWPTYPPPTAWLSADGEAGRAGVGAGGSMVTIGILALQGDVREHAQVLEGLGVRATLVRSPGALAGVDGLIVPGGESSVIDKLTRVMGLREPLRAAIAGGLPIYGTCAGMILLADRITGAAPGQLTLGGIDMTVARNAFGPQVESFETQLAAPAIADTPVRAVFIRGPVVTEVGPSAEVVATLPSTSPAVVGGLAGAEGAARPDEQIVAVMQGNLLATSFHPELCGETRFHEWLIRRADQRRERA